MVAFATTSPVSCAIPSIRHASHSAGVTSRRRVRPKFFIARTVPAMFTRSCVSQRTTTIRSVGRSPDTRSDRAVPVVRLLRGPGGDAAEEHPRGADVVPDVDQEDGEVARAPEDGGEHDPADHLGEEGED